MPTEDDGSESHAGGKAAVVRQARDLSCLRPTRKVPWTTSMSDGASWWLTGAWSRLAGRLRADPAVALVVDTCDVTTGLVRQVPASGDAEVVAFDANRARRKLKRYLGDDPGRWDQDRFGLVATGVAGSDETGFVRLTPSRMVARDLSFTPSSRGL